MKKLTEILINLISNKISVQRCPVKYLIVIKKTKVIRLDCEPQTFLSIMDPGPGGPPGGAAGSGDDARPAGGSGNPNYGIGMGSPALGKGRGRGKGPGNPELGGPPAGTTGSGGDAGPVSEQGNQGADSSLEKGTDSKGAEMVATGVNPEGPQSDKVGRKPKGRAAHRVTMSKDGKRKMSLRIGSGNPVSEVRLRQGKDKSGKTTSKMRPAKGKTVADQFADPSENTGSQGEPGSETEVNPAESMVDPMDKEVEEEVSKAFRNIPFQKK